LREYHEELGLGDMFAPGAKLQRTWRPLMRVLPETAVTHNVASLKDYQRLSLGRSNGETALIELLPLPAPGKSAPWLYGGLGIPWLRSRDVYEGDIEPRRITSIVAAIDTHHPEAVITYGRSDLWRRALGA